MGMTRAEMLQFLIELTGARDKKQAENHYDYLVRTNQLPQLKNGGRVVKAQATTTKRSCIRVGQQFRWHTLVEDV